MHERDAENWTAIDRGERPATWADFVGNVVGATYLSPAGQQLIPRLVEGLDSCFGPRWLGKAIGPNGGGRIPGLGKFSPVLTLVPYEHGPAGAFIELVRWWAAFESQADMRGMPTARRDLRKDIRLDRLLHSLTQARLGAIATSAGLKVTYEPFPGDLRLSDGHVEVTVEVFAMVTPESLRQKLHTSDSMFDYLDQLTRLHGVHFYGALPPLTSDLLAWRERVNDLAAIAGRQSEALSLQWDGFELSVAPGDGPEGATLDGPTIDGDVGTRLRARVRGKASQNAMAAVGWLWLENHGAIDMLVPIYSLPLDAQLAGYTALLDGAAAGVTSAQGVTFSSAGQRAWPPPPREELTAGSARALRQPLPLDRVRTSFHLPKVVTPEGELVWRLVRHERGWLDDALTRLGVPYTALDLVRVDLRPPLDSAAAATDGDPT